MQIGDILTLDFNEKYLLLNKVKTNKKNYFLAIGVNESETDVDYEDVTFFEEIKEKDNTYVKEVHSEELLDKLADASMLSSLNETKKIERILEEYFKEKKNNEEE